MGERRQDGAASKAGKRLRSRRPPVGRRGMLLLVLLSAAASLLCMRPAYGVNGVQVLSLRLGLRQLVHGFEVQGSVDGGAAAVRMMLQATAYAPGERRTLSFDVCGGFAAQRIALVSGMVLAVELNRSMVLPSLVREESGESLAFGELYDQEAFLERMRAHGLDILPEPPTADEAVSVHLDRKFDYMAALAAAYGDREHIRVDCPVAKLPGELLVKHEQLVFAALSALQPAAPLQSLLNRMKAQLRTMSATGEYNFLHLRAEEDWVAHCEKWASRGNGTACLNNTATVGTQLALHRVNRTQPLLVSVNWAAVDRSLADRAVENLKFHGYSIVLRDHILGEGKKLPVLGQEEEALVDHHLALGCHQFAGNSVSVLSALLIMERWHAGAFATYYNGGNIPLEALVPLFPLPWVFTYNDWSSGTEYEHMVKAAVTSGIRAARLKPFCMFSGSEASDMYRWLVAQGVTIIRHDPAWKEALIQEGRRHREEYSKHFSHLYKTDGALVGAFQRIDIPVLRELDQYNYVLFTDCDVFFRKQLRLIDWGAPLPTAIGMGFERYDVFPYNDGVMLWHMPYMRRTNRRFVKWILSTKNGLYYPGYGPVDQGAFNQFYEREVRGKPISKSMNSMAYYAHRSSAFIVHMHGPKPNHYLEYAQTGECSFHDLCEIGFHGGLCQYTAEYIQFAPDWPVVAALHDMCTRGTVPGHSALPTVTEERQAAVQRRRSS